MVINKERSMKNGTCPVCNSTEVYKTDFGPLQAGGSLLGLYNPKGNNLPIEVYLCATCGHVEMSIPETHHSRMADLVKTEKWKKVG
jgi:hypothetical protein